MLIIDYYQNIIQNSKEKVREIDQCTVRMLNDCLWFNLVEFNDCGCNVRVISGVKFSSGNQKISPYDLLQILSATLKLSR